MEASHTFAIVYSKKPGILIRIALVMERRGYSIESVSTTPYELNPTYSEMIVTAEGDPAKLEQVSKQVSKLIDVMAVRELKEVYC